MHIIDGTDDTLFIALHFARCTDSPCSIEPVKIPCLTDHSSLARTSRWMDSNSGSLAQRTSDTADWKVGFARSQRLHCLFTLHRLYHPQSEVQARITWKQCKSSRANTGPANFASSLGSQNSASICLPTLEGRATRETTEFSSASSRRIVKLSRAANWRWPSAAMQMFLLPQRPPWCVSMRPTKSPSKSPTVIHCSKCSWYKRSTLASRGPCRIENETQEGHSAAGEARCSNENKSLPTWAASPPSSATRVHGQLTASNQAVLFDGDRCHPDDDARRWVPCQQL